MSILFANTFLFQNLLLDSVKIRSAATTNLYAYQIPSPSNDTVPMKTPSPQRKPLTNGSLLNGHQEVAEGGRIISKVHELDKRSVVNPYARVPLNGGSNTGTGGGDINSNDINSSSQEAKSLPNG